MKFKRIDNILGGIRLRLNHTSAIHVTSYDAREFSLESVDGIRRTVHTVRRNTGVSLLNDADPRAARHFEVCEGTEGCENQIYYVNRFL